MSNDIDLIPENTLAEMLHCFRPTTLWRWRRDGNGPPYCKIGSRIFYRRESLYDFLAKTEKGRMHTVVQPRGGAHDRPVFRDEVAARNKKIKALLRETCGPKTTRVEGGRPDRGDLGVTITVKNDAIKMLAIGALLDNADLINIDDVEWQVAP